MQTIFEGNDVTFVFIDKLNDIMIIYKDIFGKRSLLIQFNELSQELLISSSVVFDNSSGGVSCFEMPANSLLAFRKEEIIFKRGITVPSDLRFVKND